MKHYGGVSAERPRAASISDDTWRGPRPRGRRNYSTLTCPDPQRRRMGRFAKLQEHSPGVLFTNQSLASHFPPTMADICALKQPFLSRPHIGARSPSMNRCSATYRGAGSPGCGRRRSCEIGSFRTSCWIPSHPETEHTRQKSLGERERARDYGQH